MPPSLKQPQKLRQSPYSTEIATPSILLYFTEAVTTQHNEAMDLLNNDKWTKTHFEFVVQEVLLSLFFKHKQILKKN